MPSYEALINRLAGWNVQVLGISIDHVPCLKAWAQSLGGIHYPLLSDFWPHGKVAQEYGVLRSEGYTERAVFIIDRDGIIQYIDIHAIGEQPSNDVLFAELAKIEPMVKLEEPVAVPTALPEGGVVMYCTSWCPDCKKARAWLKDHNITYTEVDITSYPGASEQLRKWTGGPLTTPTFNIDGKIVVDFQVSELTRLLL
jgi:glutaredoxin